MKHFPQTPQFRFAFTHPSGGSSSYLPKAGRRKSRPVGGAPVFPTATSPYSCGVCRAPLWLRLAGWPAAQVSSSLLPVFPPCGVMLLSFVSAGRPSFLPVLSLPSLVSLRGGPITSTLSESCWACAPAMGCGGEGGLCRTQIEDGSSRPLKPHPGLCPQRLHMSRNPSQSARQLGFQYPEMPPCQKARRYGPSVSGRV